MEDLPLKTENEEENPKPETFNFLGFTFYCSTSYNTGRFVIKVKTDSKKFRDKVKKFKEWIKIVRNIEEKVIIESTKLKLVGHYRYYGVTYNFECIKKYYYCVCNLLYKWLNRRSQKKSFNMEQFINKINKEWCIPRPMIYVNLLNYAYS